jgi:hypothetical protein
VEVAYEEVLPLFQERIGRLEADGLVKDVFISKLKTRAAQLESELAQAYRDADGLLEALKTNDSADSVK